MSNQRRDTASKHQGAFDADSPLLSEDEPGRAAEYCRLALQEMQRQGATLTPLNYALFYTFISGRDDLFNEKMEMVLRSEDSWRLESAIRLFLRFLSPCNDISIATFQEDLQSVLREVSESTRGIAEGVDQHTARLDQQVGRLEECRDPQTVLKLAGQVLEESRSIAQASKRLSEQMRDSVDTVEKLNREIARARHDATTDALTGLGNRARLDNELNQMVEEQACFCLLMMDIDHFKAINDQHGHLIGDRVLYQLGRILSSRTRSTDTVTRYGGEEFALLLPNTTLTDAELVAEKIRSSIHSLNMRRTDTGADIGEVTASFGVAGFCPGETVSDLLARADDALYQAKTSGRNRVVLAGADRWKEKA